MTTQTAPVSDHARRTARRVAALLAEADALLITAGSGMSAECTPPDDRELQAIEARMHGADYSFRRMAQPWRFDRDPDVAWAWYGHRQRWYRASQPHDGYRILRSWAQAMPCGSFVATTNVDGQFVRAGFTDWQVLERHGSVFRYQCSTPCIDETWSVPEPPFAIDADSLRLVGELPRCPQCGALARPNVLMYDDTRWIDAERREQQRRFDTWLASVRGKRLLVVEIGAGERAASIRRVGEKLLERSLVSLVRINPAAAGADEPVHVLRLPALQAISLIHASLPERFGGAQAVHSAPPRPEVGPIEGRIRLSLPPVTAVDLGRGLVTIVDMHGLGQAGEMVFLERYGEAQSGWVPVPACGGLEAPGYTMTARVLSSQDDPNATPGAAIVFVQAPDEQAVMTFGIGRRPDEASALWQILYESTDRPLVALDYPRLPWVARRPAAGLAQHAEVSPYLAQFQHALVRAYLPYLVFIEATRSKGGGDNS